MQTNTHTPYLGSVRFYKHCILGSLALLLLLPLTLLFLLMGQFSPVQANAAQLPPGETLPEVWPAPQAEPEVHEGPYPDLYAPAGPRATVDEEKVCYLTFDDGPSARTPEILAILEDYGVQATFFVVGGADAQREQWLRDILAGGHALGLHSNTHDYPRVYASTEAFLADYDGLFRWVTEATGVSPAIARFPGGSINGYNGDIYKELIPELTRRGFVYFDWNVSVEDAAQRGVVSAKRLVDNALNRVDDLRRAVVLLHDSTGKRTTVEALPAIIEGYRAAGFTFASLSPQVVPVIYPYPAE